MNNFPSKKIFNANIFLVRKLILYKLILFLYTFLKYYIMRVQSQRRLNLTIIVEPSTFQRLKKEVGDGKISRFVEKAIIKELNDYGGRIEEKQKEFQQKLIAGYK